MPATKHSRYKIANFSRQRLHDVLPLEISRNVLHPLTRKEIGNRASARGHKKAQKLKMSSEAFVLFVLLVAILMDLKSSITES